MKAFHLVFFLILTSVLGPSCNRLPFPAEPSSEEYTRLQQTLTRVYEQDRAVRNVDLNALESDSLAYMAFNRRMHYTDSVNQTIVLPILDRYGWLPKSKLSDNAAAALYYVVQHSNTSTIRRYLPLMERQAQRGEASATGAATMRDRLLMFEGKKQRYGTQAANWVRPEGTTVIWPIQQPNKVNALRKKVGFRATVEQNAAELGAIYDPAEKLPAEPAPFSDN